MEDTLALQIASLKEALEKQTEATAEKQAVATLKELLHVEHVDSLVPAVKERLMFLASQVEGARAEYALHVDANNLLKSKVAILKDQLNSAQARVKVLEADAEMRRQGLL